MDFGKRVSTEPIKKRDVLKERNTTKIDLDAAIIIPGLIDLHTHLPQFNIMGCCEDTDLLSWLEKYAYPSEIEFMEPSTAKRLSTKFFYECKRNGTTTLCAYLGVDLTTAEIAFEEAKTSGIRAVMGKDMMDRGVPEELLERTENSISEFSPLSGPVGEEDHGEAPEGQCMVRLADRP